MIKSAKSASVLLLLLVLIISLLAACGSAATLTGKWLWAPDNEYSDGYQQVWEFSSGGILTVTDNFEGSIPDTRHYTATDSELKITFQGDEESDAGSMSYHYIISDSGKTLTLSADGTEPMVLTRQ